MMDGRIYDHEGREVRLEQRDFISWRSPRRFVAPADDPLVTAYVEACIEFAESSRRHFRILTMLTPLAPSAAEGVDSP